MVTGAYLMFQILSQLPVTPAGLEIRQLAQFRRQQAVVRLLCLIVADTATGPSLCDIASPHSAHKRLEHALAAPAAILALKFFCQCP